MEQLLKYTNIQSIPSFKRDPIVYSFDKVHGTLNQKISCVVSTESLYVDWYKKVNLSISSWNLSIFNTSTGIIGGTLTENLIPISDCFLYLYQSSTGILAKQTISDKDGNFKFTGIASDVSYFVVAVHKAKKYNAVILDEVRIDSAL